MPEDDLVKKLVGELDKQTEPYAAWNTAQKDIQKGTGVIRAKADYTKAVSGAKVTDTVEGYATDFYGGKKEDATMLAHRLRSDLGENYGQFRNALKHGDPDRANALIRDATEGKFAAAGLEGVIERIQALSPDERIAAGKKLVEKVGGNDYVAAITNPGALAQTLTQQKRLAENYKWK